MAPSIRSCDGDQSMNWRAAESVLHALPAHAWLGTTSPLAGEGWLCLRQLPRVNVREEVPAVTRRLHDDFKRRARSQPETVRFVVTHVALRLAPDVLERAARSVY